MWIGLKDILLIEILKDGKRYWNIVRGIERELPNYRKKLN